MDTSTYIYPSSISDVLSQGLVRSTQAAPSHPLSSSHVIFSILPRFTVAQLKEDLKKRNIPFGSRALKAELKSLLQASIDKSSSSTAIASRSGSGTKRARSESVEGELHLLDLSCSKNRVEEETREGRDAWKGRVRRWARFVPFLLLSSLPRSAVALTAVNKAPADVPSLSTRSCRPFFNDQEAKKVEPITLQINHLDIHSQHGNQSYLQVLLQTQSTRTNPQTFPPPRPPNPHQNPYSLLTFLPPNSPRSCRHITAHPGYLLRVGYSVERVGDGSGLWTALGGIGRDQVWECEGGELERRGEGCGEL
jgi:hypothetical protein